MRRKSQTDCGFVEEGLVAECGRVEEAIDFVGRDAQTLASAEDDHAVLGWGGVIVEVGEGVILGGVRCSHAMRPRMHAPGGSPS